MKTRIIGFDLARAYAIFGMFIVNFNFCFGSIMNPTDSVGRFLNMFTGNSTAIFIICAGMGVALMSSGTIYSLTEKATLKSLVLKRSWFLLALGLLLYNWWPGDILHFYGGYMHIAAFLLFVPKRYYLLSALAAVAIFHLLLLLIPVTTGWDLSTYRYLDFWTPIGVLRNTLYNGWNSMFPWLSYFFVGMWLGRLNWQERKTKRIVFTTGLMVFVLIQGLRLAAKHYIVSPFWSNYISAEYFPPYLPFVLVTMGFAFMVISACMVIGEKYATNKLVLALQTTGQMTLSHYVIHLTLGMIIMEALTQKKYTGYLQHGHATSSFYILVYSSVFYVLSVLFSVFWSRKFGKGPLETIMRKIAG